VTYAEELEAAALERGRHYYSIVAPDVTARLSGTNIADFKAGAAWADPKARAEERKRIVEQLRSWADGLADDGIRWAANRLEREAGEV
jgi:hypothetical protein